MRGRVDAPRPGAEHATDRYWVVVAGIVAMFVVGAVLSETVLGRVLQSLMSGFVLFSTYRAAGVSPRRMRVTVVLAVVGALMAMFGSISGDGRLQGAALLVIGLLVGGGPVVLVRRIFERNRVTVDEIAAAFAAYVQIGLFFAFMYAGAAQLGSSPFFASGGSPRFGDFLYFSIITITTVGYGDLAPVTGVGRSLVMMETLLGQVFLVVLVARLVAQLGPRGDD
jgi:hypothetical protein